MSMISFTVPGEPKGKGRPRISKYGVHTPKDTVMYENLVKMVCPYSDMLEGELVAEIIAFYTIPNSTSKKKREQMLKCQIRPTKKPDIDNVIKAILDSLNGIAYKDDSQVVKVTAMKLYGDIPRVEVMIREREVEKK